MFLADYQECVGDQPIWALGVDLESADFTSLSVDDQMAKVAGNPGRERYETYSRMAGKERADIYVRVLAAEELGRGMREDKKREIFG